MKAVIAALLVFAPVPAHAEFDPIAFFRGRTHGEATIRIIFQSGKHLVVDSIGRAEPGGTLLLEQHIQQQGKKARTRYWRMRKTGPHRFAGVLSDATGPVSVDVVGDSVRIRYTDKDHLSFEQWLRTEGPRLVRNQMRVKRFGLVVAHVDELIRKLD